MATIIFSDQMQKPYGEWLTECLSEFGKRNLSAVCIAAIDKDTQDVLTGYWDCTPNDKAQISGNIYTDGMLDMVKANAAQILKIAEDDLYE